MSTDFLDENQKEILDIIKNNPGKSDYVFIYKKTGIDKEDISIALHRLIALMLIYKNAAIYYSVDVSVQEQNNKDAEVAASKINKLNNEQVSVPPIPTTPNIEVNKPEPVKEESMNASTDNSPKKEYGNFTRKGSNGIIAMYFYQNRKNENGYTVDEIRRELGSFVKANIGAVIYNFSSDGILDVVNNPDPDLKGKAYKWGTKLVYPFSSVLPTDCQVVPKMIPVEEEFKDGIVSVVPIAKVEMGTPPILDKEPVPKIEDGVTVPVTPKTSFDEWRENISDSTGSSSPAPTAAAAAPNVTNTHSSFIFDSTSICGIGSVSKVKVNAPEDEHKARALVILNLRIKAIETELNNLLELKKVLEY
jgi:hypothetical protein